MSSVSILDPELEQWVSPAHQRRRAALIWWSVYAAVLLGGLAIAMLALRRPHQPYLGVSAACLGLLLALWLLNQRLALVATLTLALVGDLVTVYWFPFNKNLSSVESIMFVTNSVSISPLEISLLWALLTVGYRNYATSGFLFRTGSLGRPLALFTGLVLLGLVSGLSRGGDMRVALIESRPLFYLPIFYVLVVNICTSRRDYRWLFGGALVGVFVQAILSLDFFFGLDDGTREGLEELNEHGSALGMNLFFVVVVSALALRRVAPGIRLLLLAAVVPVGWTYFIAERRAAVISLVVAMCLLAVILLWRQRSTFFKVVPIATILLVGYLGAFWNSEASAGFPAQAIKSAIAPGELEGADQSSSNYRVIENANLHFTIQTARIEGIGFGRPFYRPYELPDISTFELNRYIPHNSILWIWMKMGIFGLLTMLYLFGRSILLGARTCRTIESGIDAVITMAATSFVVMYGVFLYVDVGWDARNVLCLAVAAAVCAGDVDRRPEAV